MQIALRNLFASKLKTLIVGGIIFFSAFLVVVGTSLLDSIDQAMSQSVIGSVAGHIQVYSSESQDELEVIGGSSPEGPDLAPLDDFARVRRTLLSLTNVHAIVPMGISGGTITSGNRVDDELERLRDSVRRMKAGERSASLTAAYDAQKEYVRRMIGVLTPDHETARKLRTDQSLAGEGNDALRRAGSDEFWATFDRDPLTSLEFLENRVAPHASDAKTIFVRYIGTDPARFANSFDRMRIVDGRPIPPGKRGLLLSKYVYEDEIKLKAARRLDKIKNALRRQAKRIASDPDLRRFVSDNVNQVREIVLQLDAAKTALFRGKLQRELGSIEEDVSRLLASFFQMDDGNFERRYAFFFAELAPSLRLYDVAIGDTVVLKSVTQTGFVQSLKLRVYGTFAFRGLEDSQLAGALSIVDMVSFRELYGFLTDEKEDEIAALKADVHSQDLQRNEAEEVLFGRPTASGSEAAAGSTASTPKVAPLLALPGRLKHEDTVDSPYNPEELVGGTVLNAAVILKDPRRIDQTLTEIEASGRRAGLPLKAISWQKASGLLGQFVTVLRAVLLAAVLIIFVVALVIINNALVMATLERVAEIGTLRAVGAQRRFVLAMLVLEALVMGLLFGALGAGGGAAVVLALGKVGLPAANDYLYFFFSGPRLFPTLSTINVLTALAIVSVVSLISGLYPAWLAIRVTPRQAMQTEE